MTSGRLVFVYNADEGLAAALLDAVHKIVSPSTYPCSLCAITYEPVAMRGRWRDWVRRQPVMPRFCHRPDFRAAYPSAAGWPLPLVAVEREAGLEPLMSAAELDSVTGLDDLIARLEARLG